MQLMRIGAPGAEKRAVRISETRYVDVSDAVPDFNEAFFASRQLGGAPLDGLGKLPSAVLVVMR
jgi:hypothetical protein